MAMMRRLLAVGMVLGVCCLGVLPAKGAPKLSPDDALKKKVEHHAVTSSLGAALVDFGTEAGVTVQVDWAALEKAGIVRQTRVAVSVDEVTWRQVLEVILSRASKPGNPLSWRVEGQAILVSTQREIMRLEEGASRDIAKVTGKPAAAAAAAAGDGDGDVAAMPKNFLPSVNFENLPLKDALQFFQTVTKANFHVNWRALEASGVRPDTPITLDLKKISVARAMDLALYEVNGDRARLDRVYWVIDRGVVLISTGNALNTTLITRVVDAGGALLVQPDTAGPRIDLTNANQASPSAGSNSSGGSSSGTGRSIFTDEADQKQTTADSYGEQKKKQGEKVIESIKAAIGMDMWEPEGKGSIRIVNNKLVITQTLLGFKLLEKSMR
jgi:hypothetical protein